MSDKKIIDMAGEEARMKGEILGADGEVVDALIKRVDQMMEDPQVQAVCFGMMHISRAYAILRERLSMLAGPGNEGAAQTLAHNVMSSQSGPDGRPLPFSAGETRKEMLHTVVPLLKVVVEEKQMHERKVEALRKKHDKHLRDNGIWSSFLSSIQGDLEGQERFVRGSVILIECPEIAVNPVCLEIHMRLMSDGVRSILLSAADKEDAQKVLERTGGHGVAGLDAWLNLFADTAAQVRKLRFGDVMVLGNVEMAAPLKDDRSLLDRLVNFTHKFLIPKRQSMILVGPDIEQKLEGFDTAGIRVYRGHGARLVQSVLSPEQAAEGQEPELKVAFGEDAVMLDEIEPNPIPEEDRIQLFMEDEPKDEEKPDE